MQRDGCMSSRSLTGPVRRGALTLLEGDQMVSTGWPLVVSSLKSLLETGETQPATA
jgi:hypothetical protein